MVKTFVAELKQFVQNLLKNFMRKEQTTCLDTYPAKTVKVLGLPKAREILIVPLLAGGGGLDEPSLWFPPVKEKSSGRMCRRKDKS